MPPSRFPRLRHTAHLRLGTSAENRTEWSLWHHDPRGPLADFRGPAGRMRAIATVINEGLSAGEPRGKIDERIRTAELAGLPLTLW
ncbi:hypothetical protein [Streptomyces celluloflavus]|uniref:hypothetical protein n=1 Tax=Streptomyces celluloflavus TaxID=58344 RepID=UPI0036795564